MSRLSSDRCAVELEAEAARLAEAVHDADPALPVATCPGWRLAELTAHVGRGHRWAAAIVERRAAGGPVPVDEIEGLLQPEGASERSAWLRAGARRLADAVREAGPETEVWTWATDRTAGFWLRRMAHDTLVHRFDAELALGRDVTVRTSTFICVQGSRRHAGGVDRPCCRLVMAGWDREELHRERRAQRGGHRQHGPALGAALPTRTSCAPT